VTDERRDTLGRRIGNAGIARRRASQLIDAALRDLGARGTFPLGRGTIGYAWCEPEGAYHYDRDRTSRIAPPTSVRLTWTTNTAQPARPVRVISHNENPRAYARKLRQLNRGVK
jgi:hypothetical protein